MILNEQSSQEHKVISLFNKRLYNSETTFDLVFPMTLIKQVLVTITALLAFSQTAYGSFTTGQNVTLPHNPLIGTWTWTRKVNDCTEIYSYHADRTFRVVSGKEVATGTFTVTESPDEQGFYEEVDTIVSDHHDGMDCGNSTQDMHGKMPKAYIRFNLQHDRMVMCYKPTLSQCFGPLAKIAP